MCSGQTKKRETLLENGHFSLSGHPTGAIAIPKALNAPHPQPLCHCHGPLSRPSVRFSLFFPGLPAATAFSAASLPLTSLSKCPLITMAKQMVDPGKADKGSSPVSRSRPCSLSMACKDLHASTEMCCGRAQKLTLPSCGTLGNPRYHHGFQGPHVGSADKEAKIPFASLSCDEDIRKL